MAVTVTTLYLGQIAAPYTPATIRGAWDDTAGAVTAALVTEYDKSVAGLIATITRAEAVTTNNYDVLLYRGVSDPIGAQTFGGTVDVVIYVSENNANLNGVYHIHLYVTQGDSDTPRGDLLTDYIDSAEWTVTTRTGKALASAQAVAALAVTAGDRIVVEIGFQAQNVDATSMSGSLNYGTEEANTFAAADGSAGDTNATIRAGFLSFSAGVAMDESDVRLSQAALETVSQPNAAVRLSQAALETVSQPNAAVRLSQAALETVSQPNAAVQVSQLVLEVVSSSASVATPRAWGFVGSSAGMGFAA
jgi:hypothetical protein